MKIGPGATSLAGNFWQCVSESSTCRRIGYNINLSGRGFCRTLHFCILKDQTLDREMVLKRILFILFALMAATSGWAQSEPEHQSDTLEVYFRQGYSAWDPGYMGNGERMQAFVKRFDRLHHKDRVFNKISKIHIVSGCSPEGNWSLNQKLSKKITTTTYSFSSQIQIIL